MTNLFSVDSDVAQLTKKFRAFKAGPPQTETKTTVAILSNVSTQYLAWALQVTLQEGKIQPEIYDSSYDQWEFELRNPTSKIYSENFDFLVLVLSSTRLVLNPAARNPAAFVGHVKQLLSEYNKKKKSKIVITLPEHLQESVDHTSSFHGWVEELRSLLRSELKDMATFFDVDPLIREFGAAKWYSTKYLVTAKFGCHPNAYPYFGQELAKTVMSLIKRPVKLVIVDLDNTMWGGIVGDVGWEGVNLDADTAGYSHLMLQQYLLGLKKKGILLALCSKNDLANAKAVFEKRSEMILKFDDFIKAEVNWEPKSLNIQRILKELNLTSSGVVFLDDSKFEREEVKSAVPGIIVPELPDSIEAWTPYLARSGFFTVAGSQREDKNKTEQYQAEDLRQKEAQSFADYGDFLKNLGLVLTPLKVGPETIDRVFDLIHKTNQFNLKTLRLSLSELQTLAEGPGYCYCYRLQDKFSDYGIISVFIAEKKSDAWDINTWLMSCRSMGRGVENAVFTHFISHCRPGDVVRGEFIETPKNQPVQNLLTEMNFTGEGKLKQFHVGKTKVPSVDYVAIGGDS